MLNRVNVSIEIIFFRVSRPVDIQDDLMQFSSMKPPTIRPRGSGSSVQLEIERCDCSNFSGKNSPENSNLKLPNNHNKKRVSIMLDEVMLRNGYPSLLILGNELATRCH